jgi:hypothetical protein
MKSYQTVAFRVRANVDDIRHVMARPLFEKTKVSMNVLVIGQELWGITGAVNLSQYPTI